MLPAMTEAPRTGLLLLQLGTPDAPRPREVRRYLREFLSDPRVLDIPAPLRKLLLETVILPFRPRASARAYASIWTPEGSPLLVHSRSFQAALAKRLGDGWLVELGMRYGTPAIAAAVERLATADLERIVLFPLFPQYASSSTGSALENALAELGARWNVPEIVSVPAFYDRPGFIEALANVANETLAKAPVDHVLLSYHGLPERHVRKSDPTGLHCLEREDCCDAIVAANRSCYRAQCAATTRSLAGALGLEADAHSMAFQSRLGRDPWIRPYTDLVLPELAARGVRRLAVLCPSFVADCLETVEEIGIRGREQWEQVGGESLTLVPCLNAAPAWVDAAAGLAEEAAGRRREARGEAGTRS
jgi:ferrochelatase